MCVRGECRCVGVCMRECVRGSVGGVLGVCGGECVRGECRVCVRGECSVCV